jgi:hypothetical protein
MGKDFIVDAKLGNMAPGMKREMPMLGLIFRSATGQDGGVASTHVCRLGKRNSARSFCTAKRKNTVVSIRRNEVIAKTDGADGAWGAVNG